MDIYHAQTQEEFVKAAYELHHKCSCYDYDLVYAGQNKTIHWLYKLGRDYNILDMDYNEFRLIMTGMKRDYYGGLKGYNYYSYYYRYNRRRVWIRTWDDYRVLKGFHQSGHKKKARNRNDWWEHKGLMKTRRKVRGHWYGSYKKHLKHYGARKHRQLERQAIHHGDYEKLHRLSYKQAEDPWSWD